MHSVTKLPVGQQFLTEQQTHTQPHTIHCAGQNMRYCIFRLFNFNNQMNLLGLRDFIIICLEKKQNMGKP